MSLAQPGELVLLQADTIDETVQWLREYLEALAAKSPAEEEILDESPIEAVKSPAPAEKLSPAEVQSEVLAEVQTVAKV